eukprot:1738901-Rhodomonas_salina.1
MQLSSSTLDDDLNASLALADGPHKPFRSARGQQSIVTSLCAMWGAAANEKAEITLQGDGNKVDGNRVDEHEEEGGKVFREYKGGLHPVLDRKRHLVNRRRLLDRAGDSDSDHSESLEDMLGVLRREEGVQRVEFESESERGASGEDEGESSEEADPYFKLHDAKPGATVEVEDGMG